MKCQFDPSLINVRSDIPWFHNVFRFSLLLLLMCLIPLVSSQLFAQPLAQSKSKFVGNIYRPGGLTLSRFLNYWNQVTAENAGKWGSVEPIRNTYNWTTLDNAYNFARANGFPYRHHTLIWGQQQPGWIMSLDTASQREEIEEWIRLSGQRYPDAEFVDVVNEPLPGHAPAGYKNALGGDGATGWDWVIRAFQLARQYWPKAELHLNDYNIINSSTATTQFLVIINLLKDRGLIDGIGVQGHSFEVYGAPTSTMQANLDRLWATGLPIYITEFDINDANDNSQLERYQTIFPLLYEHPGVKGITLWGYVQYEIWQTNAYLVTDRLAERPALQWLRTYLASPLRSKPLSPNGTFNEPRNPRLVWSSSAGAVSYRLQVSAQSGFVPLAVDTTVADTVLRLGPLVLNTRYWWRVSAMNSSGTGLYSDVASFWTGDQIVGVEQLSPTPAGFVLTQNYPNPFNPTTTINYNLAVASRVSLKVYDSAGREVATLVDREQDAGGYRVEFKGDNLGSGVYFYRLQARQTDGGQAGTFQDVKGMVLMK